MSPRRLRQVAIVLALLIYILLEQYSNTTRAPRALGALLALVPLLLALALLAVRTAHPGWALAALLAIGLLVLPGLWPHLERQYARLYLLQQCGVYLVLAVAFARTLLPGATPLCTQWALRVHGVLEPAARRYTRHVTLAWALFFVAMTGISLTLYATVTHSAWSLFGNFVVLPLAALLFALEYQLRRYRLPAMRRASLAQMLGAYLASPRGTRRF
ncbi:MAG TPA: hypothetical protein VKT19_00820 [Steroidobacteraceae bacterium]|nr:hypothetical protein [Steroidobacteraceae bacterium]